MGHNEHGHIFGKMWLMILISHKQVHFVLDMLQSVLLIDLGLYCLHNSEKRFRCSSRQFVWLLPSASVYVLLQAWLLSLHHSTSSSWTIADMDDGSLQHEINMALPELNEETARTLTEHLRDIIGIRNREDLLFVEPENIKPFLTPIQSLIQVFRKGENISVS